jgi:hypothetical protein
MPAGARESIRSRRDPMTLAAALEPGLADVGSTNREWFTPAIR